MGEDDDLVVTARVLSQNREIYEALIKMSASKGMSPEEVNTHLFNAGLVVWVEQINRDMDKGLEEEVPSADIVEEE